MTFEQSYQNYLKARLEETLPGRHFTVSRDLQFEVLERDPEGIAAVIKSGNAAKSSVPGYDLNTWPLLVSFTLPANDLQELFEALGRIESEDNAEQLELSAGETDYAFRQVFTTPYALGSPFDLGTRERTIKAVNAAWMITVTYSANAVIEPQTFALTVDGTDYAFDCLYSYDMTVTQNHDAHQEYDSDLMKYDALSRVIAYNFTLYKKRNSSLQALLDADFEGESALLGKALGLKIDNSQTPLSISGYTCSYTYENHVGAYRLTLTR